MPRLEHVSDSLGHGGRQERECRQLAEAKIKVRSLEYETAERDKLLQEAQFLTRTR